MKRLFTMLLASAVAVSLTHMAWAEEPLPLTEGMMRIAPSGGEITPLPDEAGGLESRGEASLDGIASLEGNCLLWDSRAALSFPSEEDAADSASVRLSQDAPHGIYSRLDEDFDGELAFFCFSSGSLSVSDGGRATLTLYSPWDFEDLSDCHISLWDNGRLADVTALFTIGGTPTGEPGWRMKTSTLGCYILSQEELPLRAVSVETDIAVEAAPAGRPAVIESSASMDAAPVQAGQSSALGRPFLKYRYP